MNGVDLANGLDLASLRRWAAALMGGTEAGDAVLGEVLARAPRGGQGGIARALVRRAVGHPELTRPGGHPAGGSGRPAGDSDHPPGDPAAPGDLVEAFAPLSVRHRGLVLLVDVLGTPAPRAARVVRLPAASAEKEHEDALAVLGEHLGEDLEGGDDATSGAAPAEGAADRSHGSRRFVADDVVDLDAP